jgi:RNA-directed DNA polymerase
MQLDLLNNLPKPLEYDMPLLSDLFQAYFNARRNKRNTINALQFEVHFEEEIFRLYDEIISGQYHPSPSICFIVNKPVKREIFAADFRDRIIHHWIYNHLSTLYEKVFIYDSYSCRTGKGTHFGVKRMDHYMRSVSRNYQQDAWILKLDIQGYFMAIPHDLLYQKISSFVKGHSDKFSCNVNLLLNLISKTIHTYPVNHCIIKGKQSNWNGLPKTKSLFHTAKGCGLPIGNLTSQLFANIYLSDFDHYVKRDLGIKHYGRYVDDFILMHPNKEYLKHCIREIRGYLLKNLKLTLHPDKVYLQPVLKGVKYLGAVIKPHRIYIANRTMGNMFDSIQGFNEFIATNTPNMEEIAQFTQSMNSYLGIMGHYKSLRKRKRMVDSYLSQKWLAYTRIDEGYRKFVMKPIYRHRQ